MKKSPGSIGLGLAIFSMFFGAGNIIFPLFVGLSAKSYWAVGCFGLFLTAIILPLLGLFGMIRFNGNPLLFFSSFQSLSPFPENNVLFKAISFGISLLIISLLGPLGSTPRCIAIAYSTLAQDTFVSMPIFALLSCLLIFIFTLRKKYIVPIIGYLLTPLLLGSLITIIFVGIFSSAEIAPQQQPMTKVFLFGISEGYKTMDLLAAFFFSSTLLHLLTKSTSPKKRLLHGGLIGGLLLTLVYAGFCFIAAKYSHLLSNTPQELLLKQIAEQLLGSKAGIIVRIAIALACLTTSVALVAAFVDFILSSMIKNQKYYLLILGLTLAITYLVAICEFQAISSMLSPILSIIYPGLILITIVNCMIPVKTIEKVSDKI